VPRPVPLRASRGVELVRRQRPMRAALWTTPPSRPVRDHRHQGLSRLRHLAQAWPARRLPAQPGSRPRDLPAAVRLPLAGFAVAAAEFDFTELDRILPHPVYARQGWVSVLTRVREPATRYASWPAIAHRRARIGTAESASPALAQRDGTRLQGDGPLRAQHRL